MCPDVEALSPHGESTRNLKESVGRETDSRMLIYELILYVDDQWLSGPKINFSLT